MNHGKRARGDRQDVCARGVALDSACPRGFLGGLVWALQSYRAHSRGTNPQTALAYQVQSIPTLLVFKDGRLAERIVGAVPKQVIVDKLQSVVA